MAAAPRFVVQAGCGSISMYHFKSVRPYGYHCYDKVLGSEPKSRRRQMTRRRADVAAPGVSICSTGSCSVWSENGQTWRGGRPIDAIFLPPLSLQDFKQ